MPRRKKTFAERHPEVDKLRVDFLNPSVAGGKEGPMVFMTQKNADGKDMTLIFHVDVALKTFKGLMPLLRKFKQKKLFAVYGTCGDDIDRFTGPTKLPEGMNGPRTPDGRYGRLTDQPQFDEFSMRVIPND